LDGVEIVGKMTVGMAIICGTRSGLQLNGSCWLDDGSHCLLHGSRGQFDDESGCRLDGRWRLLGALCSMGNESSRERIIGLMGAVVGSMGTMVGAMGGDVVGSMMRAIVCLMGHWPGGLMELSRERIIGLMEAVVGSMGAMVGSMGGDVVGSMGAIRSMGDKSSRERIIGLMEAVVGSMGDESSRERIIGLMEAVVGSMGAMVGSMEDVAGSMMKAVVGSMGAIRSMGDESS
jgi:hypothetical protein